MKIFVAWSVDQLDGLTATALMADNVAELRDISQSIRRGSDNIKQWAMAVGGSPVLDLSTVGAVEVPADRMTELPGIAQKFEAICEGTMSIGVGMTLSEAYTAMRFSALKGGNQISLYHVEMEHDVMSSHHEAPDALAGLGKAGDEDLMGELVGPQDEQQHNLGGEFVANPAEGHEAIPEADMALGQAPQPVQDPAAAGALEGPPDSDPNGGVQIQAGGDGQAGGGEVDPRTVVVQALQKIKQQSAVLQQMKQSNPAAFEAVKAVVDAMILMAQGMATEQTEGDAGKQVKKSELQKDLMPGGKGDKQPDSKFDTKQLELGVRMEQEEHGLDPERAKEVAKDHLTEDPNYYKKAEMPAMPDKNYAVGTQKDGKVKVRHEDVETGAPGKTAWRSIRSGAIMSEDGHPVSSRNPSGS